MKRCFVISPIGGEGSKIREHADDVFDYIIKPAMQACGIEAFRSDHLTDPGRISEQMFNAILREDLCIAVLTGFNPNVFYELAIAQAAARPVIILLKKGHGLPFDIKDLRCVSYDLKPRTLMEKVYVKEIIGHVRSLEKANWKGPPLLPGITPLGDSPINGQPVRFVPRARDFGSDDAWLNWIRATERAFDTMGITLDSWRRNKGFRELLIEKARSGCQVRVLLMHKDNRALHYLFSERTPAPDPDNKELLLSALAINTRFFLDLAEQHPAIQIRQMRWGCPYTGISRTDQKLVLTQFLNSEESRHSPLWEVSAGFALYQIGCQEFDLLWKMNSRGGESGYDESSKSSSPDGKR